MSFSIEYNRKMFTVPFPGDVLSYLLLIKMGDSNVYETHTGLRTRDWILAFFGKEYEFWPFIGKRGGYCEGGGLQKAKGWKETEWMPIEQYLSIYRKAFRTAKSIENLFSLFDFSLWIELRGNKELPMTLDNVKIPDKKAAIELFLNKKSQALSVSSTYYGEKTSEAHIPITNIDDLLTAIALRGAVSSSVEGFSGHAWFLIEEKGKGGR